MGTVREEAFQSMTNIVYGGGLWSNLPPSEKQGYAINKRAPE